MTFLNDRTEEFLLIFDQYQARIRAAEGCLALTLLRDTSDARIFFTYSQWTDSRFIEQYRHSKVFGEVWPRVKSLFTEPAEAWSIESIVEL